MTDESRLLRDALRIAVPVEPEETVAARRARLVGVLEREIITAPERVQREQARVRLRRGLRWVAIAAALACTLGLGMAVSRHNHSAPAGPAIAQRSPTESPVERVVPSDDQKSLSGRNFETSAGHKKVVRLSGQTELSLAAQTKVQVLRDSPELQDVHLTSGGISMSVPKRRTPRLVRVHTAHATVIVKGTVFGVEVGRFNQPEGTPHRTRVLVSRGQVLVQHPGGEVSLEPGDSWLSPLHTFGSTNTERKLSSANGDRSGAHSKKNSPTEAASSTLAAQNRLLEQALAAEKRGDTERAKSLIQEFLSRYPSSPLRGSALVVKGRLQR